MNIPLNTSFSSRDQILSHSHGSLCFSPASQHLPEQIPHPVGTVISVGLSTQMPQKLSPQTSSGKCSCCCYSVPVVIAAKLFCHSLRGELEEVIAEPGTRPHAGSGAVHSEKCFQGGKTSDECMLLRYVCMSFEK